MNKSLLSTIAVVALGMFGCASDDPMFTLSISAATTTEMRGDTIVYRAGSFTVDVTATMTGTDTNLSTLAAELLVATSTGASSTVAKTTLLRNASDPHVFQGPALLAWPPGGDVSVTSSGRRRTSTRW